MDGCSRKALVGIRGNFFNSDRTLSSLKNKQFRNDKYLIICQLFYIQKNKLKEHWGYINELQKKTEIVVIPTFQDIIQ